MVMFQPDRILLRSHIAEFGDHITGLTLDVGAGGYNRYSHLFRSKRVIRLDITIATKPDIVADAHALPFKQEAFDSIICTQVLGDLSDPRESLREFYSVLRKGGIILITESQVNELHDAPLDYWRFTRFGLEHLCRSCGLGIIAVRQRGGFFTMLAQQCIRYCIGRFNLYHHPVIGRTLNLPLRLIGRLLMVLDHFDKSEANRKHTIGWLVLAKK